MIRRIVLAATAALSLAACATTPAPQSARGQAFPAGVVSAADPRAAEAGAQMLRKGGTATDAAIATMLALTVVEPQSSGIGGGGFFMHSSPTGAIATLDGRERAPAGAGPDWFLGPDGKPLGYREAVMSGLSVGVPGNIALAAEAHRQHGKLPWRALFRPAIALARDGWSLTDRFAMFLERMGERASSDPASKALYFGADGKPLPVGTRLTNPALAATLEKIAKGGPRAFYKGAIADGIAAKVAAKTPRPGAMTAADLADYRVAAREPVCGRYRTYRICGMAPPSSGATTVLAILGQIERFDLAALGKNSPVAWHLFAESQRLAYADRERFIADPAFIAVPVVELIDPTYLAKRSALIDPARTMASVEPGLSLPPPDGMEPPENGTSHFVAVDKAGNAVTYTSTIEGPFGSGLMTGGFHLNNELTDFSFAPGEPGRLIANRVQGGKRPRSSMAPTFVYDQQGRLVLAIGAAGGGTIPVQVARALIGFIDWNLPIAEALALPVVYAPQDSVTVEQGAMADALVAALKALGHKDVTVRQLPTKTNAIAVHPGALTGAADPRSEGAAITEELAGIPSQL